MASADTDPASSVGAGAGSTPAPGVGPRFQRAPGEPFRAALQPSPALFIAVLIALWCVGMFGRGLYTPDEPREADLAWRMSWQADKAVPLLAGEPFCEKPPLTYWAAALPIRAFGMHAWSARLPNLFYAFVATLAMGLLGRRAVGGSPAGTRASAGGTAELPARGIVAGVAAAGAIATFLLAYQVSIWLATDAPLLAAVAVSLLGLYLGFHAPDSRRRLRGYLLMHAGLAAAFMAKSAAGWMTPALALGVLIVWERRWRELVRWELYAGLIGQAAVILLWIAWVYAGPDGREHLKVFFWNNLVGRFTRVDAQGDLQYAAGHRNTPGKYLYELPLYLVPWTLLVAAALRRAWLERHDLPDAVRFALASSVPALVLLSFAATARNVYMAPVLPGLALLLAWWIAESALTRTRWDARALKATSAALALGAVLLAAAAAAAGFDAWRSGTWPSGIGHFVYVALSMLGVFVALSLARQAWRDAETAGTAAPWRLFLAYGALLIFPISQLYARADAWQDLAALGKAVRTDAGGRPLVLFAPDETTRAWVDLYVDTKAVSIPGPADANGLARLSGLTEALPSGRVVVQERGPLTWLGDAGLTLEHRYTLPHGRTYVMLVRRR